MRDTVYQGWKRVLPASGKIHYFREALSLCGATRLFADSPTLKNGKVCVQCLKRRADEKRRAA